MASFPQKPG